MIQNTIVFIVNGDGSFFKQPPNTKFTANSVNKNSIFVIAPFVNTASIIANFKVAHKAQQVSRVATLTTMKPREITKESYVFDWNVWEVKVPQPTLQFLANNRGTDILVSFNVGETTPSRVPTNFDTPLGEITDTGFILPNIEEDGRYIVKVASYQYATGKYAFFNDTIIADNTAQEYKIFRAKYSGGPTPSVAFKVDPSIPMENFDEYEPTVVEQLILQANENSGDIVNLENEVVRIDNKIDDEITGVEQELEDHIEDLDNPHAVTAEQIDTYVKTTIDNKDANTLQEAKDYTYSKVEIDNKDTAIMNKANNLENANMFKDVNYNNVNGVLTFTKYDDTTKAIDLPLELLVESGYYDEVTNELVLVLANGSEIRIPVGNLLTDLDAHNIRFNGSGTNYLVSKTEVESAVKELDTRVKNNADDKQDKLIAGANISIIGNTISASGGGGGEVDLSNYVTVSNLETTLLDYVETEVGKGLSTNDYTNTDKNKVDNIDQIYTSAEKTKLSGIQVGAQVNPTVAQIKTQYESNANTNAFTDGEKSKLASLESSKFVGQYISLSQLQSAHPTASVGAYAFVDQGSGSDVIKYIWDSNDTKWVLSGEVNQEITEAQVKTLYEGNADTNAFTDTEKSKLSGIQEGAEVNVKPNWNAASGNVAEILNKPTIDGLLGGLASLGFVKRNGTNSYIIDATTYQPLDADLSSIAAISGTSGLLKKTASNTWQLDTSVYLTAITKAQVETVLTGVITTHTHNPAQVNTDASNRFVTDTQISTWNNKVDKVSGKDLSTEDYTTTEKNKLSGIEAGAEVNVQSNWNATSGDAFILNKPAIPTKVSDLSNDAEYITGYTETDPIFTAWNKSTGISITKSQVSDLIEATQALSGLMSATDKQRLDVLHALLEEDTENSVVDSINEVLEIFNNYPEGADLVTALAGKVDKVTGKGLSTNDYTTTEKNKLAGIDSGAEVNEVNSVNTKQGVVVLNQDDIGDGTTYKRVSQTEKNTWNNKQDELIAGDNITIVGNTISASGGGGGEVDLNEMAYFNYAGSIYGAKYSLLVSAWEHSLIVDPLEISENSVSGTPRGTAQYPNGETEGVIIPHGVTSIGNYAFNDWQENNQPLIIPNSVTSIGAIAFNMWSSNNQPLVIPNSVTSIGDGAFNMWSSNNQPLVIPNSVTSIGDGAFQGWSSNNQPLVIPNSVTSIEEVAFSSWSANNQPLVIPDSVTSISQYAFEYWTSVPYVELKRTTPPTLVNANAFSNQNDAPIYVPDASVTAYKVATNWVSLASRIFPVSDKGNTYTKGEIDLMMGDIESLLEEI